VQEKEKARGARVEGRDQKEMSLRAEPREAWQSTPIIFAFASLSPGGRGQG